VGTAKRERQKANRALRLQEEAKAARVSTVKRNTLRWLVVGLVAIGGVVLIAALGGAFSGDDTPSIDITTPLTLPTSLPTSLPDSVPDSVQESVPTSTTAAP
jgi:hypothetical protein